MKTQLQTAFAFLGGCAVTASLLFTGCGRLGTNQTAVAPAVGGSPAVNAVLSSTGSGAGDGAGRNFVRTVAAKVEPAVVTVHTLAAVRRPMTLDDLMMGRGGMTGVRKGAGSGVIISPDGYILTNNHVVTGAQRVTVEVGGTGYDARVVGTDLLSDIAVVKISPPGGASLPVAQLGDSDAVQVGDWAVAIGDPLDIGTTVTLGIISAIGARGPHQQGETASTVLQTDAAINPGNSGGALADNNGKVIGINEAIASPTGSFIGIGFAIPINAAKKIAQQLIATGRVVRPYLGISYVPVKSVPPQVRAQSGIDPSLTSGVAIGQVASGSPAAAAGLRPGDVILSADGQALTDQDALDKVMAAHSVGDTIRLQVQRGSQKTDVPLTLRERPATYGVPTGGEGQ
ncbi:MAG: trypsin-like peptidase domain-containing protein [Armatimonadota bacterium]|nr:trypsin-like peptidase domain-containing protein [Armatimonadota bacterium]